MTDEADRKPAAADALPAYALEARPKRIKRVKLALLLASLAACVSVTIIGFVLIGLMEAFSAVARVRAFSGENNVLSGAMLAFQLSALNFFIFFITVPAAALALGLSIGRMPHRGVTRLAPYLRWGGIWGAILVGATTGLFGMLGGALSFAGALLAGLGVGALAGLICGLIFHAIINPAKQAGELDVSIF
ncbi:MAG: hypothetical protein ACK4MQ_10570 [Hyphomonas sp.]